MITFAKVQNAAKSTTKFVVAETKWLARETARGVVTGVMCTAAAAGGAVMGAAVAAYTVAKQRG